MYAATFGCEIFKSVPFACTKCVEVGCKVYEYFWVHVYAFWVHVYGSGGSMYAVVGCKSMERLGACLTVGSLPDSR